MPYHNHILAQAIMDSLGELGESTMEAILRHLRETHVSLAPEDLDLHDVEIELLNLFGEGAVVLMRQISWHYTTRTMLNMKNEDIKKLTPLEKIQRFAKVND